MKSQIRPGIVPLLAIAFAGVLPASYAEDYNTLMIPEAITGKTFNLKLSESGKQFWEGAKTKTYGYNGAYFWGPTLIMSKGDDVQVNVTNSLTDTTTVHWHGFHIPAIMDGGPHQVVPAGTTWSPTFTVKNDAATYWYHPHLHGTTQEQLTKGAGGFIIVRDPQEAALALPRTYGVDDIPLALTSRRFVADNQFAHDHILDNYGDYMLVNGTMYPQVKLPKQIVRLRILNAEIERGYNLGFGDNRTFHVIGNDSGLLNTPVAVTRVKLMVGERVEILVDLGADKPGSSLNLRCYNSGQRFGYPGQEGRPMRPSGRSGPINGSLLNNTDFDVLHIVVAEPTSKPITKVPATLVHNTYWTESDVTNSRTIGLTGGAGGSEFTLNNSPFTPTVFNQTVKLNAIEKWNVANNNIFGHSFHIHDVKFNIISRSVGEVSTDGKAAPYEQGWKDTLYVPKGETVSFIAKFDDFASPTYPFMYHCHFAHHEDGGMMGQFLVVNENIDDLAIASFTRTGANKLITFDFKAIAGTTYTLQFSETQTTGSWADIGSVTSNGTSATFTETDATRLARPRGFYRVILPKDTGRQQAVADRGDRPPRGQPPDQSGPDGGGGQRPGRLLLNALDLNRDGTIDATELAKASASLKALDKNRDGKLTTDEYSQQPPGGGPGGQGGPGDRRRVMPLIDALDLNHDGIIAADEIAKAGESLKKLDKNGDGKLTTDEYEPPRPGGGPGGPGGQRPRQDGGGPRPPTPDKP